MYELSGPTESARQRAWEERRRSKSLLYEPEIPWKPEIKGQADPKRDRWIGIVVLVAAAVLISLFMSASTPAEPRPDHEVTSAELADGGVLFNGVAEAEIGRTYAVDHNWRASSHPFKNKVDVPWRLALRRGEHVRVIAVKRHVRVYWDWATKNPHPYDDTNYSLVQSLDDPSKPPVWTIDNNLDDLKR